MLTIRAKLKYQIIEIIYLTLSNILKFSLLKGNDWNLIHQKLIEKLFII